MSGKQRNFARRIASLSSETLAVAWRPIEAGDEAACEGDERLLQRPLPLRRQSGAARIVARELLESFGALSAPLRAGEDGLAIWPPGFIGSLAHDGEIAVAAVARADHYCFVGIDVEPDEPLPEELVAMVATQTERARCSESPLRSRRLFVLKEAVFKALYPRLKLFLDFSDIEIDCEAAVAIAAGQRLRIALAQVPALIGLAYAERC